MRFVGMLLVLSACVSQVAAQGDPVFSGPQPGEPLTSFKIRTVLGDDAGKDVDPVTVGKDKATVIIFVHERTRPAFGLTNTIMRFVASQPKKTFGAVAFLSADPTETENWMKRIPSYFPKGVTIGISPDGQEGPGAYGLNRNVSLTILVASEGKVRANFAIVQPSIQADGPKILKAIVETTGGGEVPDIAKFSGRQMTRRADSGSSREMDGNLRPLIAAVIQKDATENEVVAAAEKVEEYAKKNEAARKQIGEITNRIIKADRLKNYGTEKAQEYLQKWAEEYSDKADGSSESDKKR